MKATKSNTVSRVRRDSLIASIAEFDKAIAAMKEQGEIWQVRNKQVIECDKQIVTMFSDQAMMKQEIEDLTERFEHRFTLDDDWYDEISKTVGALKDMAHPSLFQRLRRLVRPAAKVVAGAAALFIIAAIWFLCCVAAFVG